MSSETSDDGATPLTTFKEAFSVLQRHAETLRRQQDPNIDELVNIVTESVNAYRICKARIAAVEQALERTLGEADESSSTSAPLDKLEVRTAPSKTEADQTPSNEPPSEHDFDDDIPF
jgi:exodeoxyribonuclease VII small subunit